MEKACDLWIIYSVVRKKLKSIFSIVHLIEHAHIFWNKICSTDSLSHFCVFGHMWVQLTPTIFIFALLLIMNCWLIISSILSSVIVLRMVLAVNTTARPSYRITWFCLRFLGASSRGIQFAEIKQRYHHTSTFRGVRLSTLPPKGRRPSIVSTLIFSLVRRRVMRMSRMDWVVTHSVIQRRIMILTMWNRVMRSCA